MAERKPLPADLAAILERVRVTGLTDRSVNEAANLAQGWLSGARAGRYGPQAQGWKQLRSWLDRYEAKALPPGSLPGRPATAAPPPAKAAPAPQALADAVRAATTHRRIGKALELLGVEVLLGTVDARTAERLESALKARQRSLKEERIERGMAKVSALRVLLPDELELLERHRAAIAPPPVKPGEKPPPPDEAPERVVLPCAACGGSAVRVEIRPRAAPPVEAPPAASSQDPGVGRP